MDNQVYLEERKRTACIVKMVSLRTLAVNALLTVLKAVFGFMFFNVSVLSDAIHSASDVAATLLVIISAAVSKPNGDKEHNYGHEKRESLIVLFFSLILGATGVFLVVQGINGLLDIREVTISPLLIGITVFSVISKEAMFWYTIHYAKKTGSAALKSDAWHHRSDSLASVAVLIGLLFSLVIKTNLAESIAVIVVALFIIKVAFDVLRSSVNQLTDKAADEKTCSEILTAAKKVSGVQNVDKLSTRLFGAAIFVDIEIGVDCSLSVDEAHIIADHVHDTIESLPRHIKHCNVHVNPSKLGN